MIKSYSRAEVKLIDFGSSCYDTDTKPPYICSRSYRAPEVIFGHQFDSRIDIWSLAAVLAELHTGNVLFQNESVASMLARMVGIMGEFPDYMLREGSETASFCTPGGQLFEVDEAGGVSLVHPKRTTLQARLHLETEVAAGAVEESSFVAFVASMLDLDWKRRPIADAALQHPWLRDAYDVDVFWE